MLKPALHLFLLSLFSVAFTQLRSQGFIIPAGAYVVAGNGNLVMSSNWINNGSFTHTGGTLIFAGSTQTLGGSSATAFNNLTTATGSTTTISTSGHTIKNVVLSNGTLNANGNLTLLSTATQTAAVSGSGTGEVLGNLIVQRYIGSGFGYKYFSSPFQADNVNDFSNDLNLAASFPSFYKFDENLASNGWVNYTNTAGALQPFYGYAANLGASFAPKTVDLKGVVNNHTVSVTLYNHNMAYTQGFNLVGNPYPSPVNWDAAGGWTKTNIDNAIYFFNAGNTNQYTGVYSSYINGVSSDGTAGSTIAALQGFFVHVSNGGYPVTGLLSVNNSARIINSTANFYRVGGQDDQPLLRIQAALPGLTTLSDPLTFYFTDEATAVFNKKADALKLLNTDSLIPNLFAVSKDVQKLSIRALPSLHDSLTTVPLGLMLKMGGQVSIRAKDIRGIPAGTHVYFLDAATGGVHDLQKDSVFQFTLNAGDYENRFFLKFSNLEPDPNSGTTAAENLSAYSTAGRLFVNPHLATGEKATLTLVNASGQVLLRQEMSGNTFQALPGSFSSAVYILHLSGASTQCVKKIFVASH